MDTLDDVMNRYLYGQLRASDIPMFGALVASCRPAAATPAPPRPKKATSRRGSRPNKIDVAVAAVTHSPELSDAKVAEIVKCHRSYLSRNKRYQRAAERIRANLRDARASQ